MRLGQLARKLSLRPAQIIEFLAQSNIQIEDNSNSRIEDSHVEMVVKFFAPDMLNQVVEVEEIEESEEVVEISVPVIEPEIESVAEPVVAEVTEESQPSSEPEVIRVPKIELSGLKVLGKIDLPEPKKKEVVSEEGENPDASEKPERKRNTKRDGKERRQQPRNLRNPVEAQREREARQAEEKRRLEIEREKERRKKHYENKRKSQTQPKREKFTKQPPEIRRSVDTRPVPKTWFGKFLRWWTT